MDRIRRWGWIIPFSAWRRAILRWLGRLPAIRTRQLGTFQVSAVSGLDFGAPLQFGTAGLLAAGEVRNRVVVVEGKPATRPTILLNCAFNHRVWDGVDAMNFLTEVSGVLEGGELEEEFSACTS